MSSMKTLDKWSQLSAIIRTLSFHKLNYHFAYFYVHAGRISELDLSFSWSTTNILVMRDSVVFNVSTDLPSACFRSVSLFLNPRFMSCEKSVYTTFKHLCCRDGTSFWVENEIIHSYDCCSFSLAILYELEGVSCQICWLRAFLSLSNGPGIHF
jgi:hypothetical protein